MLHVKSGLLLLLKALVKLTLFILALLLRLHFESCDQLVVVCNLI